MAPDLGTAFADVLTAARADAGWAYRRLFDAHARRVLAYLRSQGAEDPDGTANEVFLRAFRNLDRFEGDEAAFRAWLIVIARNRLIDERRHQQRRPVVTPAADFDGAPAAAAEREALDNLGAEWVHRLLDDLTAEQRDVLLLRIVADLTVVQIAQVLGKQPGAVKQLQRRAIEALRRRLAAEEAAGQYPFTPPVRLEER